ncbi:hypothetical protein CTEN210_11915 [Chaetoceros tenuissimus]|uniref:Uncharacterized protein n=1 Tax=Chaetoceros tenuissimus TaxID=426638 RepID=A0AAD3D3K1_9STRA|nr:hypothetical protein CTEN210_11915 [Chaetoceros tenuissimus]
MTSSFVFKYKTKQELLKAAEDEALLLYNSSEYTWAGNHFLPPQGVPTFTPIDYREYFSKRNTLFIGDSTGRRAYATLFAMMSSCNNDYDNVKVKDMDSSTTIDFNKPLQVATSANSRTEVCNIRTRNFHGINEFVCRDILNATTWLLCPKNQEDLERNVTKKDLNATYTSNNTQIDARSRFDFIRRDCLVDVHEFFSKHDTLMQDYDLVVVSSGIWEILRPNGCKMNLPYFNKELNRTSTFTATIEMKVDALLDILTATSSSKLQIVLRSPGFDNRYSHDTRMMTIGEKMRKLMMGTNSSYAFSLASHEIFQNETAKGDHPLRAVKPYSSYNYSSWRNFSKDIGSNITFVDWQSVIAKRSFGEDRINGDINPHYGLEARHLFAQQLLHQLRKLELQHRAR